MGIEEEADRTLFIRNLDTRVTEELLFELFLQAGPLIKTKIPKDADGKQKTFGFAVYKHEVSVPYAMQLLDGSPLFGKNIHVQFRSGSSHSNSPGSSKNSSPANTPDPHGERTPAQFNSPSYTPPSQMQRSPGNLQKQVMMNNIMWQVHMRQLEQLNGGLSKPLQLQSTGDHRRQHDSTPYRQYSSQNSRGHHYSGVEDCPGRQGRDGYHHHNHHHNHRSDWSGSRHHNNRGGHRQYDERSGNYGYQDNKRRRY